MVRKERGEAPKKTSNMTISDSIHKDTIAKYFDYTWDFDFLDLIATALDRAENLKDPESLYGETYDYLALLSAPEQWRIMAFYQSPDDADLDRAEYDFVSDVCAIAERITNEETDD